MGSIFLCLWLIKTTIDLTDELFQRTKPTAASRHTSIQNLLIEGLERVLEPMTDKKFLFAYAWGEGPNHHCGLRENCFLTPFAAFVYRKTAPSLQAFCFCA